MSNAKERDNSDALPKLLPCPFCGKAPWVGFDKPPYREIGCANIDCSAAPLCIDDTEESTVAAWNTRAGAAQSGMEVTDIEIAAWIETKEPLRPSPLATARSMLRAFHVTSRPAPQAETQYKRPASHDIDSDNPPQAEGGE